MSSKFKKCKFQILAAAAAAAETLQVIVDKYVKQVWDVV